MVWISRHITQITEDILINYGWKTSKSKEQFNTQCGVNAQHQNGREEKRIRDLQDLSRTSIMHAQKQWSDAIVTKLWPYAFRKAADDLNNIKSADKEKSPYEIFANIEVMPNLNFMHPFGCPMYVLTNELQGGMKMDK